MKLTNLNVGKEYTIQLPNATEGTLQQVSALGEVIQEVEGSALSLVFTPDTSEALFKFTSALDLAGSVTKSFIVRIFEKLDVVKAGHPVRLANLVEGQQYAILGSKGVKAPLYLEDLDGNTISSSQSTSLLFTATPEVYQVRFDASIDSTESDEQPTLYLGQTAYVPSGDTLENALPLEVLETDPTVYEFTAFQRERFHTIPTLEENKLYSVGTKDASGTYVAPLDSEGKELMGYNSSQYLVKEDGASFVKSFLSENTELSLADTVPYRVELTESTVPRGSLFKFPLVVSEADPITEEEGRILPGSHSYRYIKMEGLVPGVEYKIQFEHPTKSFGLTLYHEDGNTRGSATSSSLNPSKTFYAESTVMYIRYTVSNFSESDKTTGVSATLTRK